MSQVWVTLCLQRCIVGISFCKHHLDWGGLGCQLNPQSLVVLCLAGAVSVGSGRCSLCAAAPTRTLGVSAIRVTALQASAFLHANPRGNRGMPDPNPNGVKCWLKPRPTTTDTPPSGNSIQISCIVLPTV